MTPRSLVGLRSTNLAHAKLNLGLRVLGRRNDGYHLISSLFVPIELADRVTVEMRDGAAIRLEVDGPPEVPRGPENLAVRAGQAYFNLLGTSRSLSIRLEKRIPAAAGLGGGSSDAGAVLKALQELLTGISKASLFDMALELGSDVPFFLSNPLRPAWVSGIGEVVEVVNDLPNLSVVLVNPGLPLSTERVFKAFVASNERDLTLTPEIMHSRLSTVEVLQDFSTGGLSEALMDRMTGILANDLESAAFQLCPEMPRLRQKMIEAGAEMIGLSGSGPSLYALFYGAKESREFVRQLEPLLERGERCWCTRFLLAT